VIGWALRWAFVLGGVALFCVGILDRGAALLPDPTAPPRPAPLLGKPAAALAAGAVDTLVFQADSRGQVFVDAVINGAPMRLLVDTGASLVSLTSEDARAAGLDPRGLVYSGRADTANGRVRVAPVVLREVRLGQFSLDDVPAAVLDHLDVSLLGMSFLRRLPSYEMRDGKLTITW
jgi:aspartyl protease family protein